MIREKRRQCDLELGTGLSGRVGVCVGGGSGRSELGGVVTLTVILSSLRSRRASSFLQKVVGSGWPRGG